MEQRTSRCSARVSDTTRPGPGPIDEDVTRHYEAQTRAGSEVARAIVRGDDSGDVLRVVAGCARELAESDLATIALPDADPSWLCLAVALGLGSETLEGTLFPRQGSISAAVIGSRSAVMLDDVSADPRRQQPVVAQADLGPAMFLPLGVSSEVFGTLLVANRRGGRRFTAHDLERLQAFADQAAVACQFGRAQQQLRRLALVQDEERRAKELHDTVIQRLFATGIVLQAAVARGGPPELVQRVERAISDLDDTITAIRSAIFPRPDPGLEPPARQA